MKINIEISEEVLSLESPGGTKHTRTTVEDLDKIRLQTFLLSSAVLMSLQYPGSISNALVRNCRCVSNHANPCLCVCVCWVLGCSLHCHAGGSCYQDAGIEQRGETCALLHAGHPDF